MSGAVTGAVIGGALVGGATAVAVGAAVGAAAYGSYASNQAQKKAASAQAASDARMLKAQQTAEENARVRQQAYDVQSAQLSAPKVSYGSTAPKMNFQSNDLLIPRKSASGKALGNTGSGTYGLGF